MPTKLRKLIRDRTRGSAIEIRLPCSVRAYRVIDHDAYNVKLVCPTTGQLITLPIDSIVFDQGEGKGNQ